MNLRVLATVGLCALAVGCSDSSSSPTQPATDSRSTTTFTVALTPANEVPAITNADAGASGTAVILLSVTKDGSGSITSANAEFQITVAGFPAGTSITDAHIHGAGAGTNGGVIVNTTLTPGQLTLTNGGGSITKSGINVPADRAAAILNNPAGHYFNVHTAINPNGAIRGQLAAGTTTVTGSDGY